MTPAFNTLPAPLADAAHALRAQWRAGTSAEVVVEVPRWGVVKRRADGAVDFVSPMPCPFNYGCVPGTTGGDGDPLDALVVGPRRPRGSRCTVRVLGIVWFVDAGALDAKLVCSTGTLSPWQLGTVTIFFRVYAWAKGALNAWRGRPGTTRFAGVEVWTDPKRETDQG